MLHKFGVKQKLLISLGIIMVGLIIMSGLSYYKLKGLEKAFNETNQVTELRISIQDTFASGISTGQALRNVYIDMSDKQAI